MAVLAKLNYLRIAPRKVRQVADLIRGKGAEEAQTILNFTTKKPSLPLLKLLNQAIANAKNNFQLTPSNLFISKITVDEGPKYKRWRARARGQASEIQKKTSHITIVLDEMVKEKKKVKKEAPKKVPAEVKKEPLPFEKEKAEEKIIKPEKPKMKPEKEIKKPKKEGIFKRVFRRKAF